MKMLKKKLCYVFLYMRQLQKNTWYVIRISIN